MKNKNKQIKETTNLKNLISDFWLEEELKKTEEEGKDK